MGFKQILKGVLPDQAINQVNRSYDIIGDIAIVEIPENLEQKEKDIAEAILKFNKHVKVVCKKVSKVSGIERVRKVKVIGGEDRTETVYTEHGCKYKLDINMVFFTPRLSNERLRIADLVKKGETVIDMFAGIGPFAILLAKRGAIVHAIDINEKAFKYLQENILVNKVLNNVKSYLGDSRGIIDKNNLKADRVIMNLPEKAIDYLDAAFKASKKFIHLYAFQRDEDLSKGIIEKAKKYGKKIEVLRIVRCGDYAPGVTRVCIDIQLV